MTGTLDKAGAHTAPLGYDGSWGVYIAIINHVCPHLKSSHPAPHPLVDQGDLRGMGGLKNSVGMDDHTSQEHHLGPRGKEYVK